MGHRAASPPHFGGAARTRDILEVVSLQGLSGLALLSSPSYEMDSKGPSRWNVLESVTMLRALRDLYGAVQTLELEEAVVRQSSMEGGSGEGAGGRARAQAEMQMRCRPRRTPELKGNWT